MPHNIFSNIASPFLQVFGRAEQNHPHDGELVAEQPPAEHDQDQTGLYTSAQALSSLTEQFDTSISSGLSFFENVFCSRPTTPPRCTCITSEYDVNELIEENIDLVSKNMEAEIIDVSDDFFACAGNLIKPAAPVAKPGTFTEKGAWYDGWESRRHNPQTYDYVVFKLKYPGSIKGINMDCTTFGVGNSFCFGELEGAYVQNDEAEPIWENVIPKAPIVPNSTNFFRLQHPTKIYNLLRLKGYPDGGLNRLRVYGTVRKPEPSELTSERVDLLSAGNGGVVSGCSNLHFSHPSNLLLPGRGENMGDGWETARSRASNNSEWVILKFGAPGIVSEVIVDTKDFKGNFPQRVEIYAINTPLDKPHYHLGLKWTRIAGGRLRADALVKFPINTTNSSRIFTHLKVQIFPDGGIKRVRAMGYFMSMEAPASRTKLASKNSVISASKENETQNVDKPNSPYNLRKRPAIDYSQPTRLRKRLSMEVGGSQRTGDKIKTPPFKRLR